MTNPETSVQQLRRHLQRLSDLTGEFIPCPRCSGTGRIDRLPDVVTPTIRFEGNTLIVPCPLCRGR